MSNPHRLLARLLALIAAISMAVQPVQAQSILRDAETEALLRDMAAPLVEAAGLEPQNVDIVMINNPSINAFVAGGQVVYIHSGLIDAADTANEVQGVIAHELGHVALGHTRKRMIDFSSQNALRTALAMILSRFLPGIGVYIAGFLASLLGAHLSRTDEYEADAYASALMVKAGFGTAPQKSLFVKLNTLTGAGGAKTPADMTQVGSHDRALQG